MAKHKKRMFGSHPSVHRSYAINRVKDFREDYALYRGAPTCYGKLAYLLGMRGNLSRFLVERESIDKLRGSRSVASLRRALDVAMQDFNKKCLRKTRSAR